MDRALFDRVCSEASELSETQLRKVLSVIASCRQRANKGSRRVRPRSMGRSGKSFGALRAFGMWSSRPEVSDPVNFTTQLRRRLERGEERT